MSSTIQQAVILAAGMGTRIRNGVNALPKPLQKVAGLSLIKRTLVTLARAGVKRVVVVVGFMGDEVRAEIEGDPEIAGWELSVEFVDNPDYRKANGVSVLQASGHVAGPFILSMADHVYDTAIARVAAGADLSEADLVLCVDRRVSEVYDIDDATKVATEQGRIVAIGKTLSEFDAIDCGVFAVGQPLLSCLHQVYEERGDCSLSDGVQLLARAGRAHVADIGNAFWQDVDTQGALARAEAILLGRVPLPAIDGRPSVAQV